MQKLTITKVIVKTEDKYGKSLISKTGRPYSRASIQTNEYGATWLGGFGDPRLIVGATIEADITDREYQGKTYKDFKLAKPAPASVPVDNTEVLDEITKLQVAVGVLGTLMKEIRGMIAGEIERVYPKNPDADVPLEDLPF